MNYSLQDILKMAEISPVLVNEFKIGDFQNAIILPAEMDSKKLGIVSTKKGLKAPKWYVDAVKSDKDTIVIDTIDKIDKYNQEKFYELLKYQSISSVPFKKHIKIIVLYCDLKNVAENIISLCQIVK